MGRSASPLHPVGDRNRHDRFAANLPHVTSQLAEKRRVGSFRLLHWADMDLGVRAMFFFDVGFVDRPLARYLIRADSLTSLNRAGSLGWMDGLWLLEGLLTYEEVGRGWPEIHALRAGPVASTDPHRLSTSGVGCTFDRPR